MVFVIFVEVGEKMFFVMIVFFFFVVFLFIISIYFLINFEKIFILGVYIII